MKNQMTPSMSHEETKESLLHVVREAYGNLSGEIITLETFGQIKEGEPDHDDYKEKVEALLIVGKDLDELENTPADQIDDFKFFE